VLYGLGAADAKLDFLCKIEAAREIANKKMKTPFVLVGTFGSQTGMTGAIKLIRRKKINATHAIIGEPTEMRLVNAAKGFANLEISIPFSQEEYNYRRDHDLQESASSQSRIFSAKAGENAIMKMFEYIAHLPDGIAVMDLNGGISPSSVPSQAVLEIDTVAGFKDPILPKISRLYESLKEVEAGMMEFREEGFDPPFPTATMGMIRAFDAEVRINGMVRLPPSVDDSAYQGWMNKLEAAVKSVGATFRVKDYRKGFYTKESEFVKGAQSVLSEIGLDSALSKAARASEASVFSRHGIECLMWGPGQSVGNSQSPNESVRIGDLNTATQFYKRLMERFCL
jgi:succinyl-diaminopimelate desuccinylase